MQRTVEKTLFALLRFEINGTELCEDVKNLITPEILPALFKLSKKHDLAHLIGDALDKNGLLPEASEAKKRFLQERSMAIYRYEQIQYELEQISDVLEKAQIPFIPLKGSVLRKYYPEPWMRTSCDIDILVKKGSVKTAQESLIRELEYQVNAGVDTHDVSLFSPSGVHLELHYSLVEEGRARNASDILRNVWGNITNVPTYNKMMTNEMFYFYHIAHMAKHFEIGGCGVRPFLDIFLLKKRREYQTGEITDLLKQGGLLTFAKAAEEVAEVWFLGKTETGLSQEIQNYLLYAGMYADTENRVAVQQVKQGGCFKGLWKRIFLPHIQLKAIYPQLERYKILTPIYQVRRWGRLLFKGNANNISHELKANASLSKDKKARVEALLKNLDL